MRRLEAYIVQGGKRLRMGYTTGSCAAAAAKAAAVWLLAGRRVEAVEIRTPGGIPLRLDVEDALRGEQYAACSVEKDAGDDPDVTHGLRIWARVARIPSGVRITGGEGVGVVTKPGLSCPVGQAAINPVPRQMIEKELETLCRECGYNGGLSVEISVPGGRKAAERTFNPRLGIVEGISILGTTGIVKPMSAAALTDTLRAEMDQRRAAGAEDLLLAPGNYGMDFLRGRLGAEPVRAVLCSNFIGEALDHALYLGFRRVLLAGHAGKLVKLAAGIFLTHSGAADGRMEVLAAHAALCGAKRDTVEKIMECVTVEAAQAVLRDAGIDRAVWQSAGERMERHIGRRTGGGLQVELAVFLPEEVVYRSSGADQLLY